MPFDELTPEERVRQLEKEKRQLAAKAQEEAIEGNTSNENNFHKVTFTIIQCLIWNVLLKSSSDSLKYHFLSYTYLYEEYCILGYNVM